MQNTKFVRPNIAYKDSYVEASLEFSQEDGRENYSAEQASSDFDVYLRSINEHEQGKRLPHQFDKEFVFWLIDGEEFIGRAVIRHRVIEQGLHNGWHLGYSVRPSKRRQEYGTLILKLGLEQVAKLGATKVYLVCDSDNMPSKKMLENAGCKFEGEIPSVQEGGKSRLEYSLDLP